MTTTYQVGLEFKGTARSESSLRRLEQRLEGIEAKIKQGSRRPAFERLGGSADKANAKVKGLTGSVDRFKRELRGADAGVGKLGGALRGLERTRLGGVVGEVENLVSLGPKAGAAFAGVAAAGAAIKVTTDELGRSLKAAATEAESLRAVSTLTDTPEELRTAVRGVVRETGNLANTAEALTATYQILSAGFTDTADAAKILGPALRLGVGGFTTTEKAADSVIRALKAYNLTTNEAIEVSDKILQTQNSGIITVDQYADSIGRVAGIAATAGVSLEELNAAIASATQIQTAESAFAGLRGAILKLSAPSKQGKKTLEELGVEYGKAAIEAKGFGGVLEDVFEQSGGNAELLRKIFEDTEAIATVTAIATGNFENFNTALEAQATASGAAEEGADKAADAFKQFDNAITDLRAELGSQLLPTITQAVREITKLLNTLRKGYEEIKTATRGFVSLGGAIDVIKQSALLALGPLGQVVQTLERVNRIRESANISNPFRNSGVGSGGGDVSPARPALSAQVPIPVNVVGGLGVGGGDRSPVRGYGFAGGARSSFIRDPDAEQTGYDVTLPGGAGGRIPNPVPQLKITGTGFQGSGRGSGGSGYGGWVSGEFVGIDGKRYELFIGHFDRIDVNPGDLLSRGQTIGLQGETGRTFGAHATTHVNALQAGGNPWQVLRDEIVNPWINGFPGGAVSPNQMAQGLPAGVGGPMMDPAEQQRLNNESLTSAAQENELLSQRLNILRESDDVERQRLELNLQLTEIRQRYADLLGNALTDEERILLLDSKKLEIAAATERAEREILQAREDGLAPLRDEIGFLQARLNGTEDLYQSALDVRDAMAGGASFEQASALVETRDRLRESVAELERAELVAQSLEQTLADGVGGAIRGLIDGSKDLSDALADVAQRLGDILLNAALSNLFGGLVPGGALTGLVGRASGGNVTSGQPYLVGENGPELFSPGQSGTISNNKAFGELRSTLDTFGQGAPDMTDDLPAPDFRVDYSGATLNFNGSEYVSKEDVPRIVNQAVKQSYGYTQNRLRSRPTDRRRLGM